MTQVTDQNAAIGRSLRVRLDASPQLPSRLLSKLLAELGRTLVTRLARRETGQAIADRAGLFSTGEGVKQRIGIPGLTFHEVGAGGTSR